ncbi:hypothetical protein ABTE39_19605, partial [Acinetobacter baumannii]
INQTFVAINIFLGILKLFRQEKPHLVEYIQFLLNTGFYNMCSHANDKKNCYPYPKWREKQTKEPDNQAAI